MQSLPIGQSIVRVGQKDHDFNLSFIPLPKVESLIAEGKQRTVIDHCRSTYALHQSRVEEILREALQAETIPVKPEKPIKVVKEEKPPLDTPIEKLEIPKVEEVTPFILTYFEGRKPLVGSE